MAIVSPDEGADLNRRAGARRSPGRRLCLSAAVITKTEVAA
jgi:hypothetical protein